MPAACGSSLHRRTALTKAPGKGAPRLGRILEALESFYGEQAEGAPADPYLFLVWWHCGYPPSEARCSLGWKALEDSIGVSPAELLTARTPVLTRALEAGGIVPQIRAARVKSIARSVRDQHGGDLRGALAQLPAAGAHRLLRKFPGIGAPGADRILLFAGLAPIAAVPSNCPHVLPRIASGREPERYAQTYAQAKEILESQLPVTIEARSRAYLLLKRHGQELCRRKNPECDRCPIAAQCAFAAANA